MAKNEVCQGQKYNPFTREFCREEYDLLNGLKKNTKIRDEDEVEERSPEGFTENEYLGLQIPIMFYFNELNMSEQNQAE